MHKALYYQQTGNNQVKCMLCPHECLINEGKRGSCRVRKNDQGVLYSENYGRVTALHLDPIEKKPLYHFYPGRTILSVGTFGCNLKCRFCQNYDISQSSIENFIHFVFIYIHLFFTLRDIFRTTDCDYDNLLIL